MAVKVELFITDERNILRKEQMQNSIEGFSDYIENPTTVTFHPDTLPYYWNTGGGAGITIAAGNIDLAVPTDVIQTGLNGVPLDWTRDILWGCMSALPSDNNDQATITYQNDNAAAGGADGSFLRMGIYDNQVTLKPTERAGGIGMFNGSLPITGTATNTPPGLWVTNVMYYNAAEDNGLGGGVETGYMHHRAVAANPDRFADAPGSGAPTVLWLDRSIYDANLNHFARGRGLPFQLYAGGYHISADPGELAATWKDGIQWMHRQAMSGQHLIYPPYRQLKSPLNYAE